MPIYEFECRHCGESFERLQKLSDADPTVCPSCGQEQIKRRLTAPAFRLAGSGWYETDFKKEGDTKRNLAAKDEAPKADAPAADKGDKKPDAGAAGTKPAETKPSAPAAAAKPAPSSTGSD